MASVLTDQSPIYRSPVSHDVSVRGTTIRADLTSAGAKLTVGQAGERTEIEITPTGALPGDYFVGTFRGPRIVALVRLSEEYDSVQEADLLAMVEAEKSVAGFPSIGVVETDGVKRLQVVGGGAPARLELH
jgi:hypothetical protein